MIICRLLSVLIVLMLCPVAVQAATIGDAVKDGLAPHRAVYDVDLIATHSGSQIVNISGQMTYQWGSSCDGWTTDHHFKLFYEYADAPGMRIASDFSTYESKDGATLNFTSRRKRDGDFYQEILGIANTGSKGGKAIYSSPEKLTHDLVAGTYFPSMHTIELIKHAQKGDNFFNAQVFDGSDEEGPIEINAIIGKVKEAPKFLKKADKIDHDLLKATGRSMRLAVFPSGDDAAESDYEMTMLLHDNGIISDMIVDYDGFSVHQKMVSLEKLTPENCQN